MKIRFWDSGDGGKLTICRRIFCLLEIRFIPVIIPTIYLDWIEFGSKTPVICAPSLWTNNRGSYLQTWHGVHQIRSRTTVKKKSESDTGSDAPWLQRRGGLCGRILLSNEIKILNKIGPQEILIAQQKKINYYCTYGRNIEISKFHGPEWHAKFGVPGEKKMLSNIAFSLLWRHKNLLHHRNEMLIFFI